MHVSIYVQWELSNYKNLVCILLCQAGHIYKSTSARSTLLAFADSSWEKHYAAAVMTACMGVNQFPGRIIELRRIFYSDFKNADIWSSFCADPTIVLQQQEVDKTQNIARIANAVPVTLYSRVTVNVEIVFLNCQKCNQCLKAHKFLGLFFEGVIQLSLSLSFSLSLSLSLYFCWSGHISSSFWSKVPKITSV